MEAEFYDQPLYIDEADKKRHESAISQLCEEFSASRPIVEGIYKDILVKLKSRARIHYYLPIFVSRSIRDIFRQSNGILTIGSEASCQLKREPGAG